MSTILIRPEAHDIDTAARREVPLAFPIDWEHRELTGRDYGVDMILEIFKEGGATGNFLNLQIKGTTKEINDNIQEIKFDIPVRTFYYAEMFMAPVLLVVCPVKNTNNSIYYLWLQEYIKVVLDFEKPEWRNNKNTVRVSIPSENKMPGREEHLEYISIYPKRAYEWSQFAKLSVDLQNHIDKFYILKELTKDEFINQKDFKENKDKIADELDQIIKVINDLINLRTIFSCNPHASRILKLKDLLLTGLKDAEKIKKSGQYNNEVKTSFANLKILYCLLSIFYDYEHSHYHWKKRGIHKF
ncbi:MAG: DUF4365 domain-containing protein [bacterium]